MKKTMFPISSKLFSKVFFRWVGGGGSGVDWWLYGEKQGSDTPSFSMNTIFYKKA